MAKKNKSLTNKLDKALDYKHMLINCKVINLMETRLASNMPNSVIELEGHNIFRTDRRAVDCITVSKVWCMDTVVKETHCSAATEFCIIKCRPF